MNEKKVKEGVVLEPLTKLRTLYWFRSVLAKAGCDATQLNKKYAIDIGTPRFDLYEQGLRRPSAESLNAIDEAFDIKLGVSPLKGMSTLYTSGPEDSRLWDVLEGDVELSRSLTENFYKEDMGLKALLESSFQARVDHMFESFFTASELERFKQRSITAKPHPISSPAVLIIGLTHPDFDNEIYLKYKAGKRYPYELLVAALAMRDMAHLNKSSIGEIDYLVAGVLRVLVEDLHIIREELIEYLKSYIYQSNKRLYPAHFNILEDKDFFD